MKTFPTLESSATSLLNHSLQSGLRPGRRSALAMVLLGLFAAAIRTDAQPTKASAATIVTNVVLDVPDEETATGPRPDLLGQVHAKGGAPLPASVFIATAAPKTGTSTFCPSCYADCIKHTTADIAGRFKIESLDPQLTFQVLAVAKGFKPKYVSKVDPAKGPVEIELEAIEAGDATPNRSLRGRVVNPKGEPISGAVVEMQGIETKDGGGSWGSLPGIDPLAVTDENGEFLITAKKPFEMMTVQVTARSFAPTDFNKLASGTTRHELKLTEGATLTGRVLSGGKPLSGVSIGVSGLDRSAGNYRGHFEVGTGTNGTFAFVNLPPNVEFYVYGIMNTMKEHGAIPIQTIRSGKDGKVTRLGDLIVAPANRLAGRLVLADGKPVPPKTRLLVSREQAWDSMQLTLDEKGRFDTTGIPSETISLSARVKGYRVSAQNKSLDQLNFRMIGRADRDVTNLVYLLEKGPDLEPNYNVGSAYEWPGERPLRGAEGGIDHSREWAVSGRVLDSNTKEPIAQFQVTSGQTDQFERTSWDTLHASEGSNGVYLNYVSKRFAEPLLKVEAEGYLPASRTISANNSTNIDFILTKGTGPSGTVLNSDGKPADGATVIQIGNEFNSASLDGKGELNAYWNKNISTKTTTNGHFSFKPVWGTKSVAAASSKGFAFVSLESLATNSTLTLEPFGQILGTLKRTSGLGTNEDLDLAFANLSPGRSPINLNNHTTTDSHGRFKFINVPAGHLRISYRQPMPGPNHGGWMSPKLQDVELHPGQRLEVNIETSDRLTPDDTMSYRPPEPKRIAGAEVKGIVLNPAGQPAAESAVALQVKGKYLAIGKGAFASTGARHDGSIVAAGADGSFTLPLYEGAKSVIALNEEGYAQVSLDQLKASPQIRLQKWGRIEGTLRIGQHAGTNESVVLSTAPRPLQMRARPADRQTNDLTVTDSSSIALEPPIYEFDAFKAKTDEQGRFVITFVPPGEHGIARLVPNGENSWRHRLLGTVMVKSGETAHGTFGGNGRTIIGKIKFAESEMPDLKRASVMIKTPFSRLMEKSRQLKTDEERKAFYQSEEFRATTKVQRNFPTTLQTDGSFRVDDVLPGTYEVVFQPQLQPTLAMRSLTVFTSKQELTVSEAGKSDDSPVDWGAIEMKKLTFQIPEIPAAKK